VHASKRFAVLLREYADQSIDRSIDLFDSKHKVNVYARHTDDDDDDA